jgi:replicative DNA helicase
MQKVIQSKPSVNGGVRLSQYVAENVLTLLCLSKEHGKVVAALVKPSQFDDEVLRVLAARALDHWEKYNSPPGKTHLPDIVEDILRNNKSKGRAEAFQQAVAGMVGADYHGVNAEYVIDSITKLQQLSTLSHATLQIADLLESRREDAIEDVRNVMNETLRSTTTKSTQIGLRLGSDLDHLIAHLDRRSKPEFDTGISELDRLGAVPIRQQLNVLIAPTGIGKSWWLTHLARRAIVAGKKVLYVTLELGDGDVMQRLYQSFGRLALRPETMDVMVSDLRLDENERLVGLSARQITAQSHLQDPGIIALLKDIRKNRTHVFDRLVIIQRPNHSLTVAGLDGLIHQLAATGFEPDMVCVDYATLLDTGKGEYRRQEIGRTFEELRRLAGERNIALNTAHQANREGMTARIVTSEHIAEDISIIHTADTAAFLMQTEREDELGLARLFMSKHRTDTSKFTVVIAQNLKHGQFVRQDEDRSSISARLPANYLADYLAMLERIPAGAE